MFDSVLRPDRISQSRFGTGMCIALATHAVALALAMSLSRQAPHPIVPPTIVWPKDVPHPPRAPPRAGNTTQEASLNRRRVSRSNLVLPPTEPRQQKPPEAQSEQRLDGNPDHNDGSFKGTPFGIPGGDENSGPYVTSATLPRPSPRLDLDESTTRLTKVSGPDPEYTQQALDHDVEGTMFKCVVTIFGVVQQCHVLSSLPFMDRAVIDALERRRYKPYISNGNPVDIDYTFTIKLNLPR
jgi:periplasmic protein TonB